MKQHLNVYGNSLSLALDLYQLTMAQGYWKSGRKDDEAIFHLFFRKNPFEGGYAIAAGLQSAVDFIERFNFDNSDLEYLQTLTGNDGDPLFHKEFLTYLQNMELTVDIHAVPEGTPVFPHEPLVRVEGPLIQCQLLETALLNIINFQTLIATKASRIVRAAEGEPVLEFGLRRAQGLDGGLSASRAAVIGGCDATSNVLAGKIFGIPVKGTHAHSWVMSFDSEMEAFQAYAESAPNNCVFLVDTYDTVEGVKKAVEVGLQLRDKGHEMLGIRLDSGDLAWLSQEARRILDEGGFLDAKIVASNGLDEYTIRSLKGQNAEIRVWGVGTNLATAKDQPALGGVYKLAAIREKGSSQWEPKIKLSEQRIKTSCPGRLQVRRFWKGKGHLHLPGGEFSGDMIYNELEGEPSDNIIVDPMDHTRRNRLQGEGKDLLKPIFEGGQLVGQSHLPSDIMQIRENTLFMLERFHEGIKRFENPHQYPAGLSNDLNQQRTDLILKARGFVKYNQS